MVILVGKQGEREEGRGKRKGERDKGRGRGRRGWGEEGKKEEGLEGSMATDL